MSRSCVLQWTQSPHHWLSCHTKCWNSSAEDRRQRILPWVVYYLLSICKITQMKAAWEAELCPQVHSLQSISPSCLLPFLLLLCKALNKLLTFQISNQLGLPCRATKQRQKKTFISKQTTMLWEEDAGNVHTCTHTCTSIPRVHAWQREGGKCLSLRLIHWLASYQFTERSHGLCNVVKAFKNKKT